MDIDPFEPLGINASTMRMLDVFLLHCLLSDSPDDSPEEIAQIKHNQHLVAERGRELLRDQPRDRIVPAAGRERHDEAHRLGRIGLSVCSNRQDRRAERGIQQLSHSVPEMPPSRLTLVPVT